MKIIIGHSNMDLDCIGCIVLARKLYPDHIPIKSGSVHPRARNLYNLYEKQLNFQPVSTLDGVKLESIVMVDTQAYTRVAEYLERVDADWPEAPLAIFDHHPNEHGDFDHAERHCESYGAGATILVERLQAVGESVALTPDEATVALCGIYADTGNFTHSNVQAADLSAAGFLVGCGASIHVATSLTKAIADDQQWELFHQAVHGLRYREANGHRIAQFTLTLPKNVPGLAAVAEHVFESEQPDALFAVFVFEKRGTVLIVGRSLSEEIRVSDVLQEFGGGGHPKASSAMIKGRVVTEVLAELDDAITVRLPPAVRAADIMSSPAETISESVSLLDASRFLESINHTGVPVVNADERLIGFLTLRDIMKGRKREMMHAPVKAFMSTKVITCGPQQTLRQLAALFFEHNIGHLPVIDADRLVGIVTRSDYLRTLDR